MSKTIKIFSVWLLLLSFAGQVAAYATQFADSSETLRLHWNTRLIPIAFSTSLIKPNPYIKPDSDITGAVERSLETWEKAANIKFQVSWTDKQSISPTGKSGDGISLVTVAQTTENILLFGDDANVVSARTRVFFNRKGSITEADIVLNPYEQFSTDGLFGTFDFEATLTHEIGHLLGLEHSSISGATMHGQQGKNGVYNLSSFSSRTLAEDDISGIRALYGANSAEEKCCGAISGKLLQATGRPAKEFQVWAEGAESGRVAAGVLTNADGTFRIEGLLAGQYRLYAQDAGRDATKSFSVEELGEVSLGKGKTAVIFKKLKSETKDFDVRYVGFNGQISELAVPINGGKSYLIYVGGKNLDSGKVSIGFNSPYLTVTPKSLINHNYGADVSVISFEVNVAAEIPLGEYSFFIKSKGANTEFAVGSLTVETFINQWNSYRLLTDE
ncbi:MAG: matrixin family metalloprotease [Pyrinomonadaceae bacterium]|nr:matrixin family metalloprotease [Pyrinomonadaceae bacterium]